MCNKIIQPDNIAWLIALPVAFYHSLFDKPVQVVHRLFCLSSCQAAVVFACEAGILCKVFVDTPQAFVTISG